MRGDKHIYDVLIIGGGPAGMMAAGRAAELGARVLLIEKNRVLGKKLSISGGGRCNITNAEEDTRKLLEFYGKAREYLFSPFSQFGVKETFSFFEEKGLPLVVEARKRAFPETQNAEDVTKVMDTYIRNNNIEIHLGTKVTEVELNEDKTYTITTKKGNKLTAKNLVVSAGGLAAPNTGSTGDGFKVAKGLGHSVKEPDPNIVPLTTHEKWVHELSGVSLSYMRISFIQNGKTHIKKLGKILFTHFGISGPLVLNSAHDVKELLAYGKVEASIDLFPETDEGHLDKRVWNLFEKNKNKFVKNIFGEILPKNMVLTVLNLLNLAEREVNSVTKEERKELVHLMKNLKFEIFGVFSRMVVLHSNA